MNGRAAAPAAAPETRAAGTRPAERVLSMVTRQPRQALQLARRALENGTGSRLSAAERGRLERALGHALRASGDYRGARLAYLRARRVFAQAGLGNERAVCALGLVDADMVLGLDREALQVATEARRSFARCGDRLRLGMLETNVGNLYHRLDALEPALAHYDRASKLLAAAGAPADQRARVDFNRANIFSSLGRCREAEALYLGAREALRVAREPVLAAQVSYGIACLRFLGGEYASAMAELEQVRPELLRLGARPLLALADLDLAEVLLALRLHPEALALARSASRWFGSRGAPLELAKCHLIAGSVLAHQGRGERAGELLARADRSFRARGHDSGRAAVALARARLAERQGKPLLAARHAAQARAIFEHGGFAVRALSAGALAAEARLAAGRWSPARDLALELLARPRGAGDWHSRARLARVAGAAAAAQGDGRLALRHYRHALACADRAHLSLFIDEWRVGFLEQEPRIADEFLGVLLSHNRRPAPSKLWRWIARARGQQQRRAVARRGAGTAGGADAAPSGAPKVAPTQDVGYATASTNGAGPDPAVREAIAQLRAELEACYARLWRLAGRSRGSAGASSSSAASDPLEQRALRLEGRLRRLAGSCVPARAEPDGTQAGAEADADIECPEGEVRLVYFSASGRLGAIRVDSQGPTLVPDLGRMEEIESSMELLHYQMEVRGADPAALRDHRGRVEARAYEHLTLLARRLLEPLLGDSPVPRRIRITPYGPLFRVPFHALSWRGSALVESSEVSLDPYPSASASKRPLRIGGGAWVIGYGGPQGGGIENEVRTVARILSADGAFVQARAGHGARLETVAVAARRAALIHLAGHAVYRADHPEFSALRLSDGWLTVSDLAAMPLDGACVVLSACETGPRGVVAGAEMLGLLRGLTRAGAAAIVASLWRVHDRATVGFMRSLYARWRECGSLGAALRDVQRHAASSGTDPYLWAPFCLVGRPDVPWPGRMAGTAETGPSHVPNSAVTVARERLCRP